VAPATAAGGLRAMRREIARRWAGRRSVWAEAAPGFGDGRELEVADWRRKRRLSAVGAAAAAISGGGRGSGKRKLVGIAVSW
jgi:hypothetical protein